MAILSNSQYKQIGLDNQVEFRTLSREEKIVDMGVYLSQSDRLLALMDGVPDSVYEDEDEVKALFGRVDLRVDEFNNEITPVIQGSQSNIVDLSFSQIITFGLLADAIVRIPDSDKLVVMESLREPIGSTARTQLSSGFELSSSIWGEENRLSLYKSVLDDVQTGVKKNDIIRNLEDYLTRSGQGGQYYKAERVVDTELQRAYTRGTIESTRSFNDESELELVYVRRLSPAHKVPDICDDLEGVYRAGEPIPEVPSHPWCFSADTEVLTQNGWKFFYDIDIEKDLFLSVDLKTMDGSYVKANKFVESDYSGPMDYFTGKRFSLMTTPNHWHPVKVRRVHDYKLRAGKDLPSGDANFLATIPDYKGESVELFDFDNSYKPEVFLEFLGYYLSEGYITKRKDNSYYQVGLTQYGSKKKDRMVKVFKELFGKAWVSDSDITCRLTDIRLAEYLSSLGKAKDKHIPVDIKKLDKKYLKILFDAMIVGDGHVKKNLKKWKGGNFKPEVVYYTISKSLADDVGELMLKLGFRPSYSVREPKQVKFKNGEYLCSKCYAIRMNRSIAPSLNFIDKKSVEYNGMVYDVELEKYHTLFVRHNNKVTLSGNCTCILERKFIDDMPKNTGFKELNTYGGIYTSNKFGTKTTVY